MTRFSLDDFVSYRDDNHDDNSYEDSDSDSDGSEEEERSRSRSKPGSLAYTDSSSSGSDDEEEEHPLGFGTTRLGLFDDSFTYDKKKHRTNYYDDYSDDDGDGDGDEMEDLGAFFAPSFVQHRSLRPRARPRTVLSNARETGTLLKHHYLTAPRQHYLYSGEDGYEATMDTLMNGMDRIAHLVRAASVVQHQEEGKTQIPPPISIPASASTSTSAPSRKLQLLLHAAEKDRRNQQTLQAEIAKDKKQLSISQKRDAELLLALIQRDQAAAGLILQEEQKIEDARLEQERMEKEQREEEDRRIMEEKERKIQLQKEQRDLEVRKKKEERDKQVQHEAQIQQHKEEREKAKAKKMEYVTNAKNMVSKLSAVRQSLEFFDTSKEKHISKRRLQMKKIARGKMNTLSHDKNKIEQVTMNILQAFQESTSADIQLKQEMNNGNNSITKDMTRGTRYLMDLIASTTIVRVQAEGFNGTRGDGFPLAHMLAHVAKNASRDFNILITAHIYSVCPTAIPTLPSPDPQCTESELMESLGMLKDKKTGEYETFDRFLARTEGLISIMAEIMCSAPSDHVLFGGHRGALKWLTRFIDLIPSETSPLPLLTAPVLVAFLTAAGYMLSNKYPEQFRPMLEMITEDISKRLDTTPIGQPSATRLAKLLKGGMKEFQNTLPQGAIGDFYNASPQDPSSSSQPSANTAGLSMNSDDKNVPSTSIPTSTSAMSSSDKGQEGMDTQQSTSNPFGATTSTSFPSSTSGGIFGNNTNAMNTNTAIASNTTTFSGNSDNMNSSTTPFGTSNTTQASPFGAAPSPFGMTAAPVPAPASVQSPFGTTTTTTTNPPTQSPFGATNTVAAPGPSPFGAAAPGPSPFGTTAPGPSPFGTTAPGPSPFGTTAPGPSPFGATAPAPSPFGATAPGPSPFGATAPGPSPFGATAPGPSPFGATAPGPSPFGAATSAQSPFGTVAPAPATNPFGTSTNNQAMNSATPFGTSMNSSGAQGQGQKKPICKFFLQGNCRFGDKCKYSHDTSGAGGNNNNNQASFSNTITSPFGTSGGFGNAQGNGGVGVGAPSPFGTATGGGFANSNPINSNADGNKKQPCKFFAQGKCKFGDRCKFSHDINVGGAFGGGGGGGFNVCAPATTPFTGGGPFGSRW